MSWQRLNSNLAKEKLKDGYKYNVLTLSKHIVKAEFYVYEGNEEFAFLMPYSGTELEVSKVFIDNKRKNSDL